MQNFSLHLKYYFNRQEGCALEEKDERKIQELGESYQKLGEFFGEKVSLNTKYSISSTNSRSRIMRMEIG